MKKNLIIFFFFLLLIFATYGNLLHSYFEADEWFHFTHYLPLTVKANGWLVPIIKSFTETQSLSAGQHIDPIGEEIFYFNSKFLGIHFLPYAIISLLLHTCNSFLVFLFARELLSGKTQFLNKGKKDKSTKKLTTSFLQLFTHNGYDSSIAIAFIAGIFFAINISGMHAFTWAAFYGQNVLSVTFFLLCLIYLLKGLSQERTKYIFLSSLFLILALLTKETAVVLFFIIPLILFYRKKVFSWGLLSKVFLPPVIIYSIYRFLLPLLHFWADSQVIEQSSTNLPDLSVIVNRLLLFPLKMVSEMFFSSDAVIALLQFITPFIYPQPPSVTMQVRSQNSIQFIYGPGNDLLVVLLAFGVLTIVFFIFRSLRKQKKSEMFFALFISLLIMVFSALLLIPIGFAIPTWGYETYFDSRHFYLPSVGGAIVFAIILYQFAYYLSRFMTRRIRLSTSLVIAGCILLGLWAVQDLIFLENRLMVLVNVGNARRLMVEALKRNVPTLPKNAVFYIDANPELDSHGALQAIPPFQTHFGQVLTVIYYDRNHLPEDFFSKPFLNSDKSISYQGYYSAAGRGFGYFLSRRDLAENILSGKFLITDVYAFSNNALKNETKNITPSLRTELVTYIKERGILSDWNRNTTLLSNLVFFFPAGTTVKSITPPVASTIPTKEFLVEYQVLHANLTIKPLPIAAPVIDESTNLPDTIKKRLFFDRYHSNEVYITHIGDTFLYKVIVGESIILLTTQNDTVESRDVLEKMVGSITTQ
jgi:hypothetical protein